MPEEFSNYFSNIEKNKEEEMQKLINEISEKTNKLESSDNKTQEEN